MFLIFGIIIAGIPLGIVSIVHSGRSKGLLKAILLPLSIIGLVLTFVCLFGSVSNENIDVFTYLWLGGLAISIVTLSVAVHYRRKENNKIFDDKRKEHEESVRRANNQLSYYDELKNLKELLDSGIITQDEYNRKKTEILERK